MKNAVMFREHKKKLLADAEVRRLYDELGPEYELIRSVINTRLKKKMTQQELARKAGTGQSAISRLESGETNPSFGFLQKIATALGANLRVSFQ